ncbi:ubiquinone biosynthesis hydroxylase [Pseudorhodoplanes sp.]|uniref:ubiquinone biosynthesis hydroxylase n=1 Tax=Pseudorhodoplanes sp. TaxID=1934341 RepID=UPI002B8F6282|nr:ubiquinone biosynthesis hydroxylase [Pseudorhodoplanes sp.]HWV42405.1 ubiquinone biosynthesis hydroxylase [Pseudorhodoplanes sp.]
MVSDMTQAHSKTDILIAGGGFAGLALAIALRQGSEGGLSVALADPALDRASGDPRASAIAAAARRLFETIGVWDAIAADAQPILDMVITDSKVGNAMRPTFLTFDGEIAPGEPFAHMIENGPMIAALLDRARAEGVDLRPFAIRQFAYDPGRVTATLSDGTALPARLLVAADGARSVIREQAGIASVGWDYDQAGIVTTIAHERDHNGRAEEHFLPPGPFAILPLKGKRSSIVWTEGRDEAARLVALPDAEFLAELEQRFGLHLGDLAIAGQRRAFPLGLHVARSFIAERIALVGDAAHVIHPIAGQGLNMGLRDIAALAEAVIDSARLGIDVGAASVLERYQRWRRFDTMAMGVATDGLNRLFSNNSDVLRLFRDVGLGIVDRMPNLKDFFIREAAGLTGDVPKLLKGEAL